MRVVTSKVLAEASGLPTFDVVTVGSLKSNDDAIDPYAWLPNFGPQAEANLKLMVFNTGEHVAKMEAKQNFRIAQLAERLLEELYTEIIDMNQQTQHDRAGQDNETRRIILVGYSFGGHVIKEALLISKTHPIYYKVLEAVDAVMFLGVMHYGGHATIQKHIDFALSSELSKNKSLCNLTRHYFSQEENLIQYKDTCDRFYDSFANIQIMTFHETSTTSISLSFGIKKNLVIVNHDLASRVQQIHERCRVVGVEIDHYTMTSFPTPNSVYAKKLGEEFQKLLWAVLKNTHHTPGQCVYEVRASRDRVESLTQENETSDRPLPKLPDKKPQTKPRKQQRSVPQPRVDSLPVEIPRSDSFGIPNERSVKLPCLMTWPYERNDKFVGRDEIIRNIKSALDPDEDAVNDTKKDGDGKVKRHALVGKGGVGKTQTALAYVFGSFGKFQAILWAQAESSAKLAQSFTDFAHKLGLVSNRTDQQEAIAVAKRWFSTTKVPWLVVFDNVDRDRQDPRDNFKLLLEYWPSNTRGSVLITTQHQKCTDIYAPDYQELDRLVEEDALELLYRELEVPRSEGAEHEEAKEIVRRVGWLAFAVSQIAWIIRSKSYSFSEFLLVYGENSRKMILDTEPVPGPTSHYSYSLQTVWKMQFEDLQPNAKALMGIVSFLDPDKISEDLLLKGLSQSAHGRHEFFRQPVGFLESRGNLTGSPLVSRNKQLKVMWVHRLVQEMFHMRMEPESRQEAFETTYEMILSVWPKMPWHERRQHKFWTEQETKIHHIVRLGEVYYASVNQDENKLRASANFAELLYQGAWYYVERGFLASAESLLEIAKDICENHIEDSELILADIYGGYGAIDSERNRFQETRDDFEKQYKYLLKALEKGLWTRPHAREALALGGLAQGHAGLNELEKAEEYYHKCIEAWKECPGEPTIYQSHLATCLCFQGKLDEAERILIDVIEKRAKLYGACDTTSYRTGLLYYSLGNVLRLQTRYDDSYEVQKACLEMFRETCGEEHHCTADAWYKVAWHVQYRARTTEEYEDAIKNHDAALEIYKDSAEYDNEIARTLYMQGMAYQEIHQLEKAGENFRKAEDLRRKIMGSSYTPSIGEESYDKLVNFWSR